MKKIACMIGLAGVALAQVQFVSVLGGANEDVSFSLVQTADGGFAVAGHTYSFGAGRCDIILSRFDPDGNHLWTRVLGSDGWDEGYSLVQTTDGGFTVAGWTTRFGAGEEDIILSRFDQDGNHLWTRTLGGANWDRAYSLVQTTDGGFAVAGWTGFYSTNFGDIILSRFDPSGNHLWTRVLSGTGADTAFSLVQTTDGGFAVVGTTASFGAGGDIILSRFDPAGNHLWTRVMGGANGDYGHSIVQTTDEGFAVAGTTYSFGAGQNDILLSRLDQDGNHLWTRVLGGTWYDLGWSLVQTTDGGFAVVGWTASFGAGGWDFILSRFDPDGNHLWTHVMGEFRHDLPLSLIQTMDGGFAAAGYIEDFGTGDEDIILAKYDPSGATCMGDFITPTVSSPVLTAGSPAPTVSSPAPTVGSPSPTISSPTPTNTIVCFENVGETETPAGSQVYLRAQGNRVVFSVPVGTPARLSVYDVTGRLTDRPLDGMADAGEREITISGQPGVYLVELRVGSRYMRTKALVR